jgi:hypothetical protein
MTQPTQTCLLCGRVEVVRMDGRGFPPDIAKRRLRKRCAEAGCPCDPKYLAGFAFGGPIRGMTAELIPTRPEHEESDHA